MTAISGRGIGFGCGRSVGRGGAATAIAFAALGLGSLAATTAITAAMTTPAAAQQSNNRVADFKDWSVFVADANGPVCWIVTQPQSSKATRGGKPVSVRRGDIYLNVSFRPEQGVKNEISVVSGYPYKEGSEVEMKVGSTGYKLFSEGENAWPRPGKDDELIEAMKKGSAAVVTGQSSRGTVTTDRFSLLGFTDALNAAAERCK